MTDRFNGMPELAAQGMRGAFTFAYEAAMAARIIRIVKMKDQTADAAKRAQRAAILTVAETLLFDFAEKEVENALEARDWLRQLREKQDGIAADSSNSEPPV